jgi:predicted ribosome-associated RNA-binding protein Tma20
MKQKDPTPLSQDLEEIIEVVEVDLSALKEIMYGGDMMLPSIVTCTMALNYLQEHKII